MNTLNSYPQFCVQMFAFIRAVRYSIRVRDYKLAENNIMTEKIWNFQKNVVSKDTKQTNDGIDWGTNMYEEVSDRNEGALIHLDRHINPNPLD